MYSPFDQYGTLPRYPRQPLRNQPAGGNLDYTECVGRAITDPKTGIVDPLVSLSLTVSPSGDGEMTVSRLSVDDTGLFVTWWATGGVPGRNYTLTLTLTTVSGRVDPLTFGQVCSPELATYPLPPEPVPGPGTPITWAANGTLTAFGGFVALSTIGQWPTSSDGLLPGSFYANSTPAATYISAVPGFGPIPNPPVFLNAITGAALLAIGAMKFPQADPHVVNQLWMNGDVLCVSLG